MYRSLQAGRAIAALLVVLFHLGGALAANKYFGIKIFDKPFSFGDAGVEFFFVLSGFIIAHIHQRDIDNPSRLLPYLKKRIARIYPTYWIIFFLVYASALSSSALRQTVPHDWIIVIKSLLLAPQNSSIIGGTGAPVLIVAWSLQYEIIFYLFVASAILNRYAALLAIVIFAANYITCNIGSECSFPRSFFASNLIVLFALGVATSYFSKRAIRLSNPASIALLGTLAFFLVGSIEVLTNKEALSIDRRLVYGILSSLIIFALIKAEETGGLSFKWPFISLMGDASYALYLLHYPLISILCKGLIAIGLHGAAGALISLFIILAICAISSAVFHLYVERPILNFFSKKDK